MIDKVLSTCYKYNLFSPGDKVIVALSGGADSVALLLSLTELKDKLKIEIYGAHLNHMLRDTAIRDEEFSKEICKKYNIPFFVKRADISKIAEREKKGFEETGRNERYKFFFELKNKLSAQKIAVAHNANDQVETFFLRLLRGAGEDGLSSISYKREDNVVRPILDVTREEIIEYLNKKNEKFVTDETNFTEDYKRNKIRLSLIPYLKEKFDFNENVILNTVSAFKEDKKYFDLKIKEILNKYNLNNEFKIDLKTLNNMPQALSYRLIDKAIKNNIGKNVSRDVVLSILNLSKSEKTGKKIYLPCDFKAFIDYKMLIIKRSEEFKEYNYKLNSGENYIPEIKGTVSVLKSGSDKDAFYIDDISDLYIRNRKPGDKIYIPKIKGHKKVKDIFIDKKISLEKRNKIPLLISKGEIIWLAGLCRGKEEKNGKYMIKINMP